MRTIFHLDLDAFFVSVERILNPQLEGKVVIVGSDPQDGQGRGVISACSYEARKYGLHSGMAISKAFRLCPKGIYLKGHSKEYLYYSKEVASILNKYAPQIEQASIDEFYMDFTGTQHIYKNNRLLAKELQRVIYNQLGLPSSIGIATNKTIAKIASDFYKPKGVTEVLPGMEKEFLRLLPIERIPGIGKQTLPKLKLKGFNLAGDIAKLPEKYFTNIWGKAGSAIWKKANGYGSDIIENSKDRKSISKEHTFEMDINDLELIEKTAFYLVGKICHKVRKMNWLASTVTLKLRYHNFETLTRTKTIKATNDDNIVFSVIKELLTANYNKGIKIRLIGVGISNFCSNEEQIDLFEKESENRKQMLTAVTKLRDKFGYEIINVGKK